MSRSAVIQNTLMEKVAHGWWDGCNSVKNPWLMPDTQYRWSVNMVNRGGIPQTRPGYRLRLTLPAGNLQGLSYFQPNKADATTNDLHLVAAVNGKIYIVPFPLAQPTNWDNFRLKNIQFNPNARQVFWCVGQKTAQTSEGGEITILPTYSVLVMQDGSGTPAAFWDGKDNGHLDESSPARQTPTGGPMIWSGNRLWMGRGPIIMASDLGDPLSFTERLTGLGRGDFNIGDNCTGFAPVTSTTQDQDILAFTAEYVTKLKSSVTDREQWPSTPGFQSVVIGNGGCVANRSIIEHAGFVWWYSYSGLIAIDPSALSYVSSEMKLKDIEMGYSKRNFAPDLSMICAGAFEDYLLMSVPSGDSLNAQTMVLDYAIADELNARAAPAWNGVWTGTRPVEWVTVSVGGAKRILHASIDYQELGDGSFNHVWEAFMPDRADSYEAVDAGNVVRLIENPIYWSFETKFLGDGMDFKKLRFAELDLCEIGGEVNLRVSYTGSRGGYHEILRKKIITTLNGEGIENDVVQEIYERTGPFHVQSRRVRTRDAAVPSNFTGTVESKLAPHIDKWFGLMIQGCGRCGIDSFRIFMEATAESAAGTCEENESGVNIMTDAGQSFHFDE